jgi:hypothetical protein
MALWVDRDEFWDQFGLHCGSIGINLKTNLDGNVGR